MRDVTVATPAKRPYAPRLPAGQRREQLLDAALAIALQRGFHAVTVDGVAKEVGVTCPVVYGAFADRGELLMALADRSEARALTQLAAVFPSIPDGDADPDELLVAGISAYLSAIRDDPATWRVILLPPEGAPEEMRVRVRAHRATMLGQLSALTDWGLAHRSGPAGLDADLFARSVFTLAEGAARLMLTDPEHYPVERLVGFTRTVLSGLR
jgi:AcrR family transcriptional regulator